MKFIVKEVTPCYVEFYREVEAGSKEEALEVDRDTGGDLLGHRVGDQLSFGSSTEEIVDHTPPLYRGAE